MGSIARVDSKARLEARDSSGKFSCPLRRGELWLALKAMLSSLSPALVPSDAGLVISGELNRCKYTADDGEGEPLCLVQGGDGGTFL